MDTAQDIKRWDQLSQIIRYRYVSFSEDATGRHTNLKINESFLEFVEVTNQTGLGLEEEILNSLQENLFCLC